jgi:hypothetical protein
VDPIDFSTPEHLAAIAKFLELAQWPHRCLVTMRAMEDIVKLGLTKDAVLEAICDHLRAEKRTYVLMQESGFKAYVLLPCSVDVHRLYVKILVPPCERESDEILVIVSAHEPEYESKRKIHAKRKR